MLLILQLIPVYNHVVDEITDLLKLVSVNGIDAHSVADESGPRRLNAYSKLFVNEPIITDSAKYVSLYPL